MAEIKLSELSHLRGVLESPNKSVQGYQENDHFFAQGLKGAPCTFNCCSCSHTLTGESPWHADAYRDYKCDKCRNITYLILHKLGGPAARRTGYLLVALSKIPNEWLDYMQPDIGFMDPREIMIESGLIDKVSHDINLYHQAFAEVQRYIAKQRNR